LDRRTEFRSKKFPQLKGISRESMGLGRSIYTKPGNPDVSLAGEGPGSYK